MYITDMCIHFSRYSCRHKERRRNV